MRNLIFEQYTRTLSHSKYTPLKPKEERELMYQVSSGSAEAFEQVVNSHLRFVVYFLRKFSIPNHVDVMDVIQEANEGLIQGINRYNVDKYKVRVFSYCFYYIRFAIGQYLNEVADARNHFICGGSDFDFSGFGDQVLPVEDDSNIAKYTSEDIQNLFLKDLTKKERFIISLLFGLEPPFEPKTLRDVATMLHTTSENVRLQKIKILDKIKENNKKEIERAR